MHENKVKARNFVFLPQYVKEAVNKGMVHRVLEYGSSVWDPRCECLNEELEMVQKREATVCLHREITTMKLGVELDHWRKINVKPSRKYCIFSDCRHGFRRRRSCEAHLDQFYLELYIASMFYHDIVSYLDRVLNRDHRQTDVIVMDFAKDFDKVPHMRLYIVQTRLLRD